MLRRAYHLTEPGRVPEILRGGLKPAAARHPHAYTRYRSRVYVFDDLDSAVDAADAVDRQSRCGPLSILVIDVPRGVRFHRDAEDLDGDWGAWWTNSRIPASAISIAAEGARAPRRIRTRRTP